MQKLFSMFPSGIPGAGLVLLRISVAVHLLSATIFCSTTAMPHWLTLLLALFFALLCLGILTPVVAMFAVLVSCICLIRTNQPPTPLATILVCNALALALLGPGAYSLDAKLFGRRLLIFPNESGKEK